MNSAWFEMSDLKRWTYNNKVWVPLYAQNTLASTGDALHSGFSEEYFGAHSVIVPHTQKEAALSLEWMDVSSGHGHRPWVDDDGGFHSADIFDWGTITGVNPILVQYLEIERHTDVHIHQDLLLGLGLRREGDRWVCPDEDYIDVIRISRDHDGNPLQVDIRAEFLKDYLCAAGSGLILLTYQSRQAIEESFSQLKWGKDELTEETDQFHWSGRLLPVREGHLFSQPVNVLHASRTDTDYSEDIPVYGFPTDGTTRSKSWTVEPSGRELIRAMGEIWKREWISPAAKSPRIRGDKIESKLEFIVDNEGNKETSRTLIGPSRWLWFHPSVINDLLRKSTGVISWYTEDTGRVGGAWNRSVHFGVNSIGLVNVYAKDIATVAEVDKRVWLRHNVPPEGGVSAELLMSQMQANPANSKAPEDVFFRAVEQIQSIVRQRVGSDFFRHHSSQVAISRQIHRFQAVSLEGFFLLCKEITRYAIERIDMDLLKRLKNEDDKIGSLKRLERILTALGNDGRQMTAALAGVYDLRIADAHLPSDSKIAESMSLVGVDYSEMNVLSGKRLISNVSGALAHITYAFATGDWARVK